MNDLENDKWVPNDIAFEYYDILAYILNEKNTTHPLNQKDDDIIYGRIDVTMHSDALGTDRLGEEDTPRNPINENTILTEEND